MHPVRPLRLVLPILALTLIAAAVNPSSAREARSTAAADAAERLHELFEREWEWRLAERPLLATHVGVHTYDDRLPRMRPEDLERRATASRGFLEELEAIDPAALSTTDRVSYQMFRRQLRLRLEAHDLGDAQIPITTDEGFHIAVARLPDTMPLETVDGYEDYLARLRALPRYFGEQIDLMRRGLERGFTLPRQILEGPLVTIRTHVVDEPERSVFWQPFEEFPGRISEAARERLRRAGREAVLGAAVPAYLEFLEFMTEEYIPAARTTPGATELPRGEAYYRHQIRRYTTLDLSPQEIHRRGRAEVDRIQREMDEVIRLVGFEGSFAEFLEFLRSDPRFYADSPHELLRSAAWIAKRMDGALPSLFGTLPRQPYTVQAVPEHLAPQYTSGRYVSAPAAGTQPGIYWVNTYDLDSRPLYVLEALTFHEAVPGHHLQGALAEEQEGLPAFRRYDYISAFGEGWGLYAEWLGLEAGFYTDLYSNFGRLTYEMWRACRLVVDTGIHAMGWSRERAVEYLGSRTALSLHEVSTEIDRYISWPAQALSYKLGELTIKRLRREAEEELGPRFDVRAFHDVVLRNGSVPLTVLEELIREWIEERASELPVAAPGDDQEHS